MSGHAIHIKVDGRTYSGTYSVDRKNLTVTTAYAKKTVEVSPRVQHQALAHQLLEEMTRLINQADRAHTAIGPGRSVHLRRRPASIRV